MSARDRPAPVPGRPRASPVAEGAGGRHVCCVYTDRAAWRAAARESLVAGVGARQRVLLVDGGARDLVTGVVAGDRLVAAGAVRLATVAEVYGDREVVEPAAQVAAAARLTEQALADGYEGLRLVAEVTSLAGTAEQRDALARYEHMLERYRVSAPIRLLCGYDAGVLGSGAVAESSCLHPQVFGEAPMFRLFAGDGAAFVLAGEIDASCTGLLRSALRRALPPAAEVEVDAQELAFVDHRALLALEHHAREHGQRIVLRSASCTLARVAGLLGLESVRAVR